MGITDKICFFQNNRYSEQIVLELGCGSRKRHINAIGIDILNTPCVDIVGDVYEVLECFDNGIVDEVYSYHFVEHVSDLYQLMKSLERVVKPGGVIQIVVPHFSNPYFYSDPTHKTLFGLYTFCYLAKKSPFQRQVPNYNSCLDFSIEKVDLIFKSPQPFYIRYGIKKLAQFVFNSCTYMKEFYEETFCYLVPCYEIYYKLRRE